MQVSIHAPRAGRDSTRCRHLSAFQSFNPRAPRGARRDSTNKSTISATVSIHAPRAGRDSTIDATLELLKCFNPRAPRGARLAPISSSSHLPRFNPRAPRGARLDCGLFVAGAIEFQSTRPARGATALADHLTAQYGMFQSTRPARGATRKMQRRSRGSQCFNPRAPRGARLLSKNWMRCLHQVSIHAPRAGRDPDLPSRTTRLPMFQSTRPARGATRVQPRRAARTLCFNPRAPRGARRAEAEQIKRNLEVSIHAPRAGRDVRAPGRAQRGLCFNPRAPRGARRTLAKGNASPVSFNPRAPRGARRVYALACHPCLVVSIHAPRAGRDRDLPPVQ